MMILRFTGTDPGGKYHEFSILGSTSLETSFEALSRLVEEGWQLHYVKLIDPPTSSVYLPTEAFDGKPFLKPISQLQRQWEALLASS